MTCKYSEKSNEIESTGFLKELSLVMRRVFFATKLFSVHVEEILSSQLFLDFDDSITSLESAVNTVENTVTFVNYTLNEAVQSLDLELTILEANVSALNERIEEELVVIQETIDEVENRVEQLELTG